MTSPAFPDEKELLRRVSRENLLKTNTEIAQWVRLSGSADERAAFRYVQEQMDAYGLQTTWLEHPALISYPLDATLQVIDADGNALTSFRCLSHSFSASIENLTCEIVGLGFGKPSDYAQVQPKGKAVLVNGLASPTAVYRAEQAGAIGEVFVNDDHLHNMIVSAVWGTPTPESVERIPKTPAVSIVQADGERLRQRIAGGTTRVRINTRVFRGWQTTPIVIGALAGTASGDFVLLSGHLDSWDFGAMDNGSANATMLEVARLLAQAKPQLYRGLRVAFWSGHSHGRYSGSTWYADHYWEELHDRCVAHVNVDSTGARGATFYGSFQTHMELADLGAQVIKEHTGQTARPFRMSRAGDMSFNGIGIPALFMELSQMPLSDENTSYVTLSYGTEMGSTMPWWWHTSEDTMDKVDPAVLELDSRVYLSALWRLTTLPVLPMNMRLVIEDIRRELIDLQRVAGAHVDFGGLLDRLAELGERVEELTRRAQAARAANEIAAVNRQTKALSRVLIPATYTVAGRFEQDPAWGQPFLPSLQPARQLRELDPGSDEYQFLKTKLIRSLNAFSFALRQAAEALGG
jgi:hypothetical protein